MKSVEKSDDLRDFIIGQSLMAGDGKLLFMNADGKLPASITGDANTLDGHDSTYFAAASHSHSNATQSAAGFESAADKTNLDTLVSRVNQDLKTTASPTFAGLTVNGYIEGAVFH